MRNKIFLSVFLSFTCAWVFSQNRFTAIVKDQISGVALNGVSVQIHGTTKGHTTDKNGMITFTNLPEGKYFFELSYIGYIPDTVEINIPDTTLHEFFLPPDKKQLEEVV